MNKQKKYIAFFLLIVILLIPLRLFADSQNFVGSWSGSFQMDTVHIENINRFLSNQEIPVSYDLEGEQLTGKVSLNVKVDSEGNYIVVFKEEGVALPLSISKINGNNLHMEFNEGAYGFGDEYDVRAIADANLENDTTIRGVFTTYLPNNQIELEGTWSVNKSSSKLKLLGARNTEREQTNTHKELSSTQKAIGIVTNACLEPVTQRVIKSPVTMVQTMISIGDTIKQNCMNGYEYISAKIKNPFSSEPETQKMKEQLLNKNMDILDKLYAVNGNVSKSKYKEHQQVVQTLTEKQIQKRKEPKMEWYWSQKSSPLKKDNQESFWTKLYNNPMGTLREFLNGEIDEIKTPAQGIGVRG